MHRFILFSVLRFMLQTLYYSVLCSALYAKCPSYVVLYMQNGLGAEAPWCSWRRARGGTAPRSRHPLVGHEANVRHVCSPGYREVINTHTVGSLTIPRGSIKWV